MKFRADLYSGGERIEGHIIIDEQLFIWKPFIPKLARKLFGVDVFEVPLVDLEGYQQKGKKLIIGIHGYNEFPRFRTKHSQEIIAAIQANNHKFRMYASNEVTSEFNWRGLIELGICILAVALYIFLQKMGIL